MNPMPNAIKTIGVTGASGHLGRAVIARLQDARRAGLVVVALTRKPAAFPHPEAVDSVRFGDFADRASLVGSLRGIDRLLLVSVEGPDDERVRLHQNAIDASVKAGVGRILYTSFFDVDPASPSLVARVHRLTEEAIRRTDVAWTFLRNGPYVDNIALRIAEAAFHDGCFRMAAGTARMPFIARSDIAIAAASALLRDDEGNVVHRPSGSALLGYDALCKLISQAIGREVRYEDLSDDAHLAELVRTGTPQEYLGRRVAYAQAIRQGFMTALTDDFEKLTSYPPRAIGEVIAELGLADAVRAAHRHDTR